MGKWMLFIQILSLFMHKPSRLVHNKDGGVACEKSKHNRKAGRKV